jgi:hypothetical protein
MNFFFTTKQCINSSSLDAFSTLREFAVLIGDSHGSNYPHAGVGSIPKLKIHTQFYTQTCRNTRRAFVVSHVSY